MSSADCGSVSTWPIDIRNSSHKVLCGELVAAFENQPIYGQQAKPRKAKAAH